MQTLYLNRRITVNGKEKVRKEETVIEVQDRRIIFHDLAFCFKDDIKAMRGSRWRDEQWSVTDCPRNWLQLDILQGNDPLYKHFNQPLKTFTFREYKRKGVTKPLGAHQIEMAASGLTKGYQIWAAEMRTRKTLSAQIVIENANVPFFWIGPKAALENTKRELDLWDYQGPRIDFLTYEALTTRINDGELPPQGIVFDEASRLKTPNSKRSIAAQAATDSIRERFGFNGYVLLLSGTPSPHTPLDWWSLAEICYPGYLREGSREALEKRLAVMSTKEFDGRLCNVRKSWKENEVAFLGERLKGLVIVKFAKECIDLPALNYERIYCKPSPSLLRAAKSIAQNSATASQAMIRLRELSDGFVYKDVQEGTEPCKHCKNGKLLGGFDGSDLIEVDCAICNGTAQQPKQVRKVVEVPCPKETALSTLVDECEEHGKIVIWAAFTGSLDRIQKLLHRKGWAVVRCDGRGFVSFDPDGTQNRTPPLEQWNDHSKVAFLSHPDSGGMGLDLSASRIEVFYSNSFRAESRVQALARIQHPDNVGATAYDLCHLPSDDRAIDIVTENRRLELMTLNEALKGCLEIAA